MSIPTLNTYELFSILFHVRCITSNRVTFFANVPHSEVINSRERIEDQRASDK